MSRNANLVLSIIIGGAIGAWIWATNEPSLSTSQKSLEAHQNIPSKANKKSAPQLQVQSPAVAISASPPQNILKTDLVQKLIPKTEVIAQEYRQNPKGTPVSLQRFSEDLIPHVRQARQSLGYAKQLFQQLKKCALGDKRGPETEIASICGVTAHEVALAHPKELAADFKEFRGEVSSVVGELIDFVTGS